MLLQHIDVQVILAWLYKACEEHEAILGITALAFIIAMPPMLPGIFGRIETLQWSWTWLRSGLLNLVSLQHPTTGQTSSVTETRSRSVSIDTPSITPPAAHVIQEVPPDPKP